MFCLNSHTKGSLFFFLSFFYQACTNPQTPPLPLTTTRITEAFKINTTYQQEQLRPFSFQFTGQLNSGQNIEFFIELDPKVSSLKHDCKAITGDYSLSKETRNQKINGHFCPQKQTIELTTVNASNTLFFQGKFKDSFNQLNGNWLNIKSNPSQIVTLFNKQQYFPIQATTTFAFVATQPPSQKIDFPIPQFGVDQEGIFMHQLKDEHLTVKYFSPTRVDWNTWIDTENDHVDYHESIHTWFYNNDSNFVIIRHLILWEETIDKNGVLVESETIQTEVWQPNGNHPINIFSDNLEQEAPPQMPWYAIRNNEVIQLHERSSNGLWEWQY